MHTLLSISHKIALNNKKGNFYERNKYIFCNNKVEEENLAVSMGSLCVLATPCVVALMENAAAALADRFLTTMSLQQ
mgnify:CR=1 FL=1